MSINTRSSEQHRNLHEEPFTFSKEKQQKRILPLLLLALIIFTAAQPFFIIRLLSLSRCLYFHCGLVWSTKHRGKSLALHQSYVIIPLPSTEFNITRLVSTTPTDNTCAINRSCWQKAILSIVCLFKTLNSSQQKKLQCAKGSEEIAVIISFCWNPGTYFNVKFAELFNICPLDNYKASRSRLDFSNFSGPFIKGGNINS